MNATQTVIDFKADRYKAKLSLAELAKATGFSKGHVANVEAGTATPSTRYMEAFNRAVGNAQEALENQVPLTKLVSDLAVQAAQADELNQIIQDNTQRMRQLAKINSTIIQAVNAIARTQAVSTQPTLPTQLTTPVNVFQASERVQLEAQQDIKDTIMAVLKKWGIDKATEVNNKAKRDLIRQLISDVLDDISPLPKLNPSE